MKINDLLKKYKGRMPQIFAVLVGFVLVASLPALLNPKRDQSVMQYGGEMAVAPKGYMTDSYDAGAPMPSSVSRMASSKIMIEESAVAGDRKVVRSGSLSLLVEKTEDAILTIKDIAESLGGFVEASSVYDSPDVIYARTGEDKVSNKYGNISIRVPSTSFDQAINDIRSIAIKVERDSSNTRDVSTEYVDMEAQLKNLRAEEEQYLSVMKKAVKVEDILNVSSRLADVRGRIERMQAQFNYLSKQVDMSTITVDMRAEADIESVGTSWRPVSVAKQAVQDMLTSLVGYADGLIVFIVNIPILLLRLLITIIWLALWVLGLYLVWKIANYLKDRFLDK